jgi:hypothetical protein
MCVFHVEQMRVRGSSCFQTLSLKRWLTVYDLVTDSPMVSNQVGWPGSQTARQPGQALAMTPAKRDCIETR